MGPDGRAVSVAVLGPRTLLLTCLVAALRGHGHRACLSAQPPEPDGSAPGVLIVDVGFREAVPAVRRAAAQGWTVVAVGPRDRQDRVAAAVVAGAHAWVDTGAPFADLAELVSTAATGDLRMCDEERARWHEIHGGAEAEQRSRTERLRRLSPREREVLRLLADGRRAAEVAEDLFLALATVRSHIRSILVKLEVNSQEQAVAAFREARGD